MNRILKILLLPLAVICIASQFASAQDDAPGELQTLADLYSACKYEEVLRLSQSLHDSARLSKEQNLQRLKYTVAAYKDFGYRREADSVARLFYEKDPFYNVNAHKDDPQPFKDVIGNYYTMPKFSVWMALSKNFATPILDTVRSIVDTLPKDPDYKIDGVTVQIGMEFRPVKVLSFSIAPSYAAYELERTIGRTSRATFHYNESFRTLALPLIVEAGLFVGRERWVPSVYAGAQLKYIVRCKYNAYTEAEGSYTEVPEMKDGYQFKNRLNYSILGGARINLNLHRTTLFADFGMACDLRHFNAPGKKFDNRELIYQNLYVPDVFRLLDVSVKIGVKVNLLYKTIARHHYGYDN